jgi:putative DNA primase/helicase
MEISDPLTTAWLDCSDWGNAKRLVVIAAGKLLWIEEAQVWAWYDGKRWATDRGNIEAQRTAHKVIEHIDMEAEALGEIAMDAVALSKRLGDWCSSDIAQKRIDTLRAHAVKSGSAGMTGGMLKQARSFLSASIDDFDKDPLAYNVQNGTLRFRRDDAGVWTVTKSPHDPADRLMQVAGTEYDPKALCPFWNERLAMLTPDPEQLAAFQPLYGYTLTGLRSDQAFYVHQGKGGDGKSVTHMALARVHGDYYRHASVKSFLQGAERGGAEHRSDLVRLKGDVRFVTCDEPKARSTWDGETIKQITGSFVTARGSNERTEITYEPRFKLHAECNIIPRAPSDDKGFRRRFKLYQWKISLSDTPQGVEAIDTILEKLDAEKSGILNWLIEGALQWLATRQIPQPTAMAQVLADFWAESSPLLEWMSEWCDCSDPRQKTPAKDLYDNFKSWCEAASLEHVMSSTAFGRALRDKHHAVWKDSKGTRWRLGIRLRDQGLFGDDDLAPPDPARPQPAVHDRANATHVPGPAVADDYDYDGDDDLP